MPTVLHPADTRGYRDMGWIKLYQSFNPNRPPAPNRRHFGVMMILDNGIIAPGGKGFGMHPHENIEIVSVVVSGAMVHSDTAGHYGVNLENSVQLISAGTGVEHSEYNHSEDMPIDNLLFVIEGQVDVEGNRLQRRDGVGITEQDHLSLTISEDADLLIIDVPIQLP